MKHTFLASLAGLALLAAPALANPPAKPREASIPFVGMGSIRDWRADGSNALYVQGIGNRWYHATLMGPCNDLPFANTIGFDVRGTNQLDRFGTVVLRHQRCPITSLVESGPPPKKAKRR
jgi:hypothetical protein